MFQPKTTAVFDNQLKVQEVNVTTADSELYNANGGNLVLLIGEPVAEVRLALQKDDSANALVNFDAASISVVDSSAFTAGGDRKAVKITGCVLAANDLLVCKYIVQLS